ncbi:MAG TPA: dTMP kinase [Gemmatimonadales bacterium]|nr:dTMP kinase [Gemmatimonadales bacterium]
MSGFFLVVEGPEGAGKSTLVRALEARLRAAGHRVQMVREPGGTPLAEAARALALDPASQTGPAAELFLMLAARADLVEKVIRPRLADGAVVVTDRFDLSTTAYQVAGRGLPGGPVSAANSAATGGLVPDLTLVLDIPAGVGVARQAQAGKQLDRMERETDGFHQRVHAAYRAASGPGVVHLDAARSPAEVADAAWAEIVKRLDR